MYNYTWDKETKDDYVTYTQGDKQRVIPARIPITVLLEGEFLYGAIHSIGFPVIRLPTLNLPSCLSQPTIAFGASFEVLTGIFIVWSANSGTRTVLNQLH